MVKVFLVDDHEVVRRGLIDLLSADAELDVVGEAGSVAQALARIPALQPDVAVLDVRLPDGNGIELCRELLSRLPNLRCLMLTSFTSDEAMLDAILAGASGYVVKDIKGMELAQAIKEVGAGRSLLDNRAAAALMAKLRGAAEHSDPLSGLSDQERDPAGPARRGPDQQADRGQDVPRRENRQELRIPVVGQAGHGTAHPGGGVHLQAGPIPPPPGGVSGQDGRATITGMRADSATAALTEPSRWPEVIVGRKPSSGDHRRQTGDERPHRVIRAAHNVHKCGR